MPLNASQFLLPSTGNTDDALTAFSNKLYTRKMANERLEIAKEGKRQQGGNFLKDYLDPKQYLTGSAYDPAITTSLQAALAKGSALAQQGADIPTLLTALGPDMQMVGDYSTKAKVINGQLKQGLEQMEKNGTKGYDLEKLYHRAQQTAFHAIDPKTGQESLKHPADISTSTDYLQQAIQEHPEEVTTGGDLDAFAKSQPNQKTLSNIQQYDSKGGMNSSKVHLIAPPSFVPEVDEHGVTTGMVPKHDIATAGGQPLMHEFQDGSGKTTKAPVRLLDEGEFDNMLQQRPSIAHYLMGQVKQHWPEYEGSMPYDPHSPEAKRVARAFAYDELKRRTPTTIENAEVQGKPSAAEVRINLNGDLEEQARKRALGAAKGKAEAGDLGLTPAKPLNMVETTNRIYNNDPDYLTGATKDLEVGGKDYRGIDVTSAYQGGTMRFGHGEAQTYAKVYYDPKQRTLITEDKEGNREAHSESQLGDFMKQIAGPNKLNAFAVDRLQAQGGYKGGKYARPGDASGVIQSMDEEANKATTAKVNKGLDQLSTNGTGGGLKGINTPQGKIEEAGTRSWYQKGKYYVKVKGKADPITFDSKEEMQNFISGKKTVPAAVQPPASGKKATATDSAKIADDYLKRFAQ